MNITMIGLDTAKAVFQVHGVDSTGKAVLKRKLRRDELIPFFDKLPCCVVVIEACGAGHHWAVKAARRPRLCEAKLLAPEEARPFVKKWKTIDAADAAALCKPHRFQTSMVCANQKQRGNKAFSRCTRLERC